MIQSARRKKQKRKDFMGIIGIITVLSLGGIGIFFIASSDTLDEETMCSVKKGPNAVTAIIFDKSESYSNDQVTDIKTSFDSWLSGQEAITKNRPIDLSFFNEGNLVQLYVTDQKSLNKAEGLQPLAQLCVPKDFKKAKKIENIEFWIENPAFLEEKYNRFINVFNSEIQALTKLKEGTSPIMETLLRLSNSESFQSYAEKPHNVLIVSDMLQSSGNYDHYNSGTSWETFEKKMKGTAYTKIRLNEVDVQVFHAKREKNKKLQEDLEEFWEKFFKKSKAKLNSWIYMDG